MADAQLFNITDSGLIPAGAASEKWLKEQTRTQVWLRPVASQKARSLSQNALQWKWYGEIANAIGETPEYAHCYCKLHFGVPILRRDNDAFREKYDRYLKWYPYEEKLTAIQIVDVTSIFSVKQATEYMETVMRHCAENNIEITIPEEMK